MEVRSGYKQTEFGVLPDDWDAGPIGRAVERLEAGASVNSEKDEAPEFGSYPCVLKTGAAREGSFDPRESKRVARRDLWRLKVSLRKDTILVSRMNTVDLVGDSGYVDADYPNLFVPDRMWMTTIRSTGRVYPRWLSYILAWQPVKSRISASATGTSGSMKNISKPSFRAVEIPYPPVEEQRAIAEALSDADALIESLEQLLTKKRHLKQGAMQELLTGKTPLPGFSGAWEVKRLGEIGSMFGGLTGKTKHDFGHGAARYITFMNIMTNVVIDCGTFEFVDIKPTESQNRVAKGDLFFNGSSETPEEVGMCAVLAQDVQDVCLNSFCFGFRFRDGAPADGLYLAYFFRSREGRELLKSLAQGATRYNLSKTALLKVAFPLPQRPEQAAIAAILSDMDAEIAVLESKLAKARQLKQGMMQELLTGRIRLV